MNRRLGAALAALLVAAAACRGMGGARPRLTPLHGSVTRMVVIPADSATRVLAAALAARDVPVAAVAPAEGYVESAWYDVTDGVARDPAPGRFAHVVKLRFYSDPVGRQTRVVGEAVRRVIVDPSLPERELERIVPPEHAGRVLLDSVMGVLPRDVRRDTSDARRNP